MQRRLMVYQKDITDELIQIFEANALVDLSYKDDDIIIVTDEEYYHNEPTNYEDIYELLANDFNGEVTMYIEPYSKEEFPFINRMREFIKTLPHRLYYFEDIIPYVVLQNNVEFKHQIKAYIESQVKSEVIETVIAFIENNMNSSQSADKLFMHRNTLNYRVDNFVEKVHIDVKHFKGANAVYMLYHY
ncbi:MAG: helix-turn-helix domain-containing protein [Candidatus Izemoplasma sp.]|nr:helix-turn-helix domain-containing protein [Candidatus Izemoplasma sp.]